MRDPQTADQKLFPVQRPGFTSHGPTSRENAQVSESVYMAAYEVYSAVYAPQLEMIQGGCRGGFSTGELIAFLYARSFPRNEWSVRVHAALNGMKNL